ncbi:hypothetical protein [Paraburkholderia acidisoli]|uniref:Peptidase C1A papain C-terminal domain-containing protein n=1 Tax=Paraburkholderia acidisoli TaxID=2571748 RepID=A0A7Z2JJ16_9BURK|nr:hypothetical protein [Paraburkholderia acidisoli]QGZ66336.1 hypothetical protein FAZ98_31575 [Paraburkholderia acidisoli]
MDWMTAVKSWNSLGNDRYGCCTAAAAFHIVQTWFANNGVDFQPTEAQTLALYSATSDFPKEDDGAVETRVLAYWSATGIPTPDGTDTIAFSALMPTNLNELKLSIEYFGAAYIGINLPISAQTQDVWTWRRAARWGMARQAVGAAMRCHCLPTTRRVSRASRGASR